MRVEKAGPSRRSACETPNVSKSSLVVRISFNAFGPPRIADHGMWLFKNGNSSFRVVAERGFAPGFSAEVGAAKINRILVEPFDRLSIDCDPMS